MKIIRRESRQQDPYYTPMRSLIDDFFNYSPMRWDDFDSVPADVWEEDKNIFVKMSMPGVKKEDIKISVTGDTLTIEAESKDEKEEKEGKKYYMRSLESFSYSQRFNLPSLIDSEKVEAEFKDGIVTVKLPKSKESETKQISIK
jgi:HSP20 family protein